MESIIRKYYPDAKPGREITNESIGKLTGEFGFELDKTLLATSVCSDEIIRSATNFRDYVDENPFFLGGLAGFPFSGITGMKAFISHLPEQGGAIILYGPHIGITSDGQVGFVNRKGQSNPSSCCGALHSSLNYLTSRKKNLPDRQDDYQMYLIDKLLEEEMKGESNVTGLPETTEVMYRLIDRKILKLTKEISREKPDCKFALVGGVIVNTDYGKPDWFDLRRIELVKI